MKRYENYKDSGVDWIGEIPEHWEINKIKYLSKLKSIPNNVNEDLLSVYLNDGVIKFNDVEAKRTNVTSLDLSKYQLVERGDLVLNNQQAWRGSVGVSSYKGIVSPAYIVLELKEIFNPQFANYLFRDKMMVTNYLLSSKGVGTIQRNLYWPSLKEVLTYCPPIQEQEAIAAFLDEKSTKIDALIAVKEKQIELLKERRQAVINQAVTKGITPNVDLKDSGIDWIGEIPEHWEVTRFRDTFKLGKGLTITKENLQDDGVFCVNYGEIHSKYGFEVNPLVHKLKCVSEDYLIKSSDSLLDNGDFIFADTSEDILGAGNFTYVNSVQKIFAGYHTVIARPAKLVNSKFLAYEFDSVGFRTQIRSRVKGVKVYSITQGLLKNLSLWLPQVEEQNAIVLHLDLETSKIDKAIKIKADQISQLKDYKQSLINEVVTGKVRVN